MARPQESRKAAVDKPPPPIEPTDRTAAVYLATLLLVAVACFFPLLRYFFAQDDFVLLHRVVRGGWATVTDFFTQTSGMFRPLTKAVYFGAMYKVFGLNSAPYHVVSMVVHLLNIVMMYLLLRRVRMTRAAALVATTLFGLSISFFHIIAWASCIQQLLGECSMLASLIWGIDYLQSGSSRARRTSLAAYVLALLSLEQTMAVPAMLFLYAWLAPGAPGAGIAPAEAVKRLASHLAVMALYLLFMVFWKTTPQTGDYAFSFGSNLVVNLVTYLGWSLHFGVVLPSRMATGSIPWHVSHLLLLLLVAYHLFHRRWREVVFGLSFFVMAVSPALFLSNHTFYLHTYLPSFGVLYLIALFAEDILALRVLRADRSRVTVLGGVLVAMSVVSFVMVRKNEQYKMFGVLDLQRSFVLRRATIAANIYDGVVERRSPREETQRVYMVYGREGGRDTARWNNQNVIEATGQGSLLNLIYGAPEMPVEFKVAGDQIGWDEQFVSDIFFFDDLGNCGLMPPPEGGN